MSKKITSNTKLPPNPVYVEAVEDKALELLRKLRDMCKTEEEWEQLKEDLIKRYNG